MNKNTLFRSLRKILLLLLSATLCFSMLTACSITEMVAQGNGLIDYLFEGNTEPSDHVPTPSQQTIPSNQSGTAPTEPPVTQATLPIDEPIMQPEVRFFAIVTEEGTEVYSSPNQASTKVATLKYGQRIAVYGAEGGWLKLSNGWAIQESFYVESMESENPRGYGVITGTDVNLREGPGRQHQSLGYYNKGDLTYVLYEFYYDDLWWGYTGIGWVCLDYVYIHGTMSKNYGFATVTGDVVNIRLGPGTQHQVVRTVKEGEVLEVYNYITVKNVNWACVDGGWICMKYVDFIKYS